MQTALRKMGNSTGMIVPKPILDALGIATGTKLDLAVDNGRVVATPVKTGVRDGWEAAAASIGAEALTAEEGEWLAAPHDDRDWEW